MATTNKLELTKDDWLLISANTLELVDQYLTRKRIPKLLAHKVATLMLNDMNKPDDLMYHIVMVRALQEMRVERGDNSRLSKPE